MSLCASVYMCFVVTCWERADLLALVCGVYCEFVTFPLVSWVRCGTWLYRFLIFAPLLTSKKLILKKSQQMTTKVSKSSSLQRVITFRLIRGRSGSVVECLTWDRRVAGSSFTGVTALCPSARHINPSLVLVQPMKTCPFITERLLIGRRESNKKNNSAYWNYLRFYAIICWINVCQIQINISMSTQIKDKDEQIKKKEKKKMKCYSGLEPTSFECRGEPLIHYCDFFHS